uniref:Uncharacterized protein n=1 Tax=Caenorhabditis tropicalis TaxID=1561998 RepID=A0A1I7TBJ8_9PELO
MHRNQQGEEEAKDYEGISTRECIKHPIALFTVIPLPNGFRTVASLTSAHGGTCAKRIWGSTEEMEDIDDGAKQWDSEETGGGGATTGRGEQEAGDSTTTTEGSATRRRHRERKKLQNDKQKV